MDVFDCIRSRRSIRNFLVRPVEFDKITAILEAGTFAPSAGNLQEWRFILVTDKALIEKVGLYALGQQWIATAPVVIVVCGIHDRQEKYYGEKGKKLYCPQNAAAAIQNMLLTTHALGLGSCWVGGFDEGNIRFYLNIPNDATPYAILPIGYPDEEPEERHVNPLTQFVYFNTYGRRIEHLHRVLQDWSQEWVRQAQKVKPYSQTEFHKLKVGLKKAGEHVRTVVEKMRKPAEKKTEETPAKPALKPVLDKKKKSLRKQQLKEFDFDYYQRK